MWCNKRMHQTSIKVYKNIHGWAGQVIPRKLCKKLKFDHTNKWYIQNPESVLEN